MRSALAFSLFVIVGCVTSFAQDEMKAFPVAAKGMVRFVWHPPALENESEARIEIIVGKMVEVDGVNRHSLAGSVREETIQGWGYLRYMVRSTGAIVGTLMAVPPGTPKVRKFITLGGGPKLYEYNSRLPVVVYAPQGFIMKIRVWKPSGEAVESPVG